LADQKGIQPDDGGGNGPGKVKQSPADRLKVLLRVCRAFHKTPDEIRAVEVSDYCAMLESMGECPPVDEAFYHGFRGEKQQQSQKTDLGTRSARAEFMQTL
jgi:hypothetical protein